ncbi:MAG TPA: hypothetical protein DEQ40_00370 [Oxalobacteraceae bacterium]|nr:hypothetical protein [Oxalobacteraceae bacterium]
MAAYITGAATIIAGRAIAEAIHYGLKGLNLELGLSDYGMHIGQKLDGLSTAIESVAEAIESK